MKNQLNVKFFETNTPIQNLLKRVWNTLKCVVSILRNETNNRNALMRTYIRLKIKHVFFSKRKRGKERILGFTFHYIDFGNFLYAFEEIMVNKMYYFSADSRNPVIIDCGGNIGIATLFFKTLYPESTITAFEPNSAAYETFAKNIEVNDLKNVTLHNCAIYNSEGTMNFHYDSEDPGALSSSLLENNEPKGFSGVEAVRTVSLSGLINQPVDFLKLDVEGVEDIVIEDLLNNGKLKLVKRICIEYHHHLTPVKPSQYTLSTMLKILEENGFRYHICSFLMPPYINILKDEPQNFLIYAYQN